MESLALLRTLVWERFTESSEESKESSSMSQDKLKIIVPILCFENDHLA